MVLVPIEVEFCIKRDEVHCVALRNPTFQDVMDSVVLVPKDHDSYNRQPLIAELGNFRIQQKQRMQAQGFPAKEEES